MTFKPGLLLPVLLSLYSLTLAAPPDEPARPASPGDTAADVEKAIRSYEKAFNSGDAQRVAELWSERAVYENRDTGERSDGRDAVLNDMTKFFKAHPKARLAIDIERIRLIQPDVARVEGTTNLFASGQTAERQNFLAIYVKQQDGQWLIDTAEEFEAHRHRNAQSALGQLDWLVGRWVDESDELRVETDVRWAPGNAFLIRSYLVGSGEESKRGTQVIGWDPINQQIRSWTFDADGSFGEGTWSRNGNEWLVRTTFTTSDGDIVSGTQVMNRISDQRITVQTIGQELNGQPEPSRDPVTVVRASDKSREETIPAPQGVQR